VLLDPFEEEFNLPSSLIEFRDGACYELLVVRKLEKVPSRFFVEVMNPSDSFGVSLASFWTDKFDLAIASNSLTWCDRA